MLMPMTPWWRAAAAAAAVDAVSQWILARRKAATPRPIVTFYRSYSHTQPAVSIYTATIKYVPKTVAVCDKAQYVLDRDEI